MTDVPHLYDYTALYEPKDIQKHLGALLTGQGARSIYDSVCQCNRCGYCAQVCPTFRLTGTEGETARGRNQLMRMLMNGRLIASENGRDTGRLFNNCLLCGACERVCYTGVRTPLHVWEGLLALKVKRFPDSVRAVFSSMAKERGSVRGQLLALNLGRALAGGILSLFTPRAAEVSPYAMLGNPLFSFTAPNTDGDGPKCASEDASCIYFLSCSEEFVSPETGEAALSLIRAFVGKPFVMKSSCCGFYAFMSGEIETARAALKSVVEEYERVSGERQLPLICSCADCAGFFRSAEQIFSEDEDMRPRAAKFAAAVREVAELMAPEFFEERATASGGESAPAATGHFPAGMGRSAKTSAAVEVLLRRIFANDYHPHTESAMPSGAYGGYPFVNRITANQLLKRKSAAVAGVQAGLVVTTTAAEAAWISAGLKRYCTGAGAAHYCIVLRNFVQGKFHADKI